MPRLPETGAGAGAAAAATATAVALPPRERLARLDFAFTERDAPAARERIADDLDAIARAVVAADPHLHALVLTGGFSRGEGTVRDGAPINDYDLVAVRSRPGGRALYRDLGHELTRRIGLEVDLMPVWRRRLRYVGPKLFWLDVGLGGRVIAGDPRALQELPPLVAKDLPRREAARLLGNRAAGLLLALPGPRAPPDPHLTALQGAKAVLAAMDATLLHKGLYAARLRERLALSAGHPHHATFAAAVDWKLKGADPASAVTWEEAAAVLLDAVEETKARACADGLAEVLVHLLLTRRLAPNPSQRVRLAAWDLLAASRWPDGPDAETARRILRRLAPHDAGVTWSSLKEAFFDLRAKTLQ